MRPNPPSSRGPNRAAIVGLFVLTVLSGCATDPVRKPAPPDPVASAAEKSLADGIRLYEEGRYEAAIARLQGALDQGLRGRIDTIQAHKHLAFIHCSTGANEPCAAAFREILRLDPKFELSKAEAGHPMWGPVFVTVRKEARN